MLSPVIRGVAPLLTLSLILGSGCSSRPIVGEPPIVGLDELQIAEQTATVELSVRNVNTRPLPVERVSMQLLHEVELLAERESEPGIDLVANGTENFTVDFEANPRLKVLLDELASGQRDSLSYRLTGTVWTTEGQPLSFRHAGHLYPVPGRENHYRASGHSESRRHRSRERVEFRSTQ